MTYGQILDEYAESQDIIFRHCSIKGKIQDISEAKGIDFTGKNLTEVMEDILAMIEATAPVEENEPEQIDISGMTRVQLQEICKQLGVSKNGTKAELTVRILSAGGYKI